MQVEQERLALAAVPERLSRHFPDADAAVVEAAVLVSHAQITGRVRDFVPLLVERAARERLAAFHRSGPPSEMAVRSWADHRPT